MLQIFTIVQNGMPFIKHHLPEFSKLSCPWHWHIVEGPAAPHGCTGWCKPFPREYHSGFRSIDGTTEYIDSILCKDISVSRKNRYWRGKVEMCNAPLGKISVGDVLHEIDADELWAASQLELIHDLFSYDGFGRGQYLCKPFLGMDIELLFEPMKHDWIRTHVYRGGLWQSHENPVIRWNGKHMERDISSSMGLVFDHPAYVFEEQVAFKERYYGDRSFKLANWLKLQSNTVWPVKLDEFWPETAGHDWLANKTEPVTIPR